MISLPQLASSDAGSDADRGRQQRRLLFLSVISSIHSFNFVPLERAYIEFPLISISNNISNSSFASTFKRDTNRSILPTDIRKSLGKTAKEIGLTPHFKARRTRNSGASHWVSLSSASLFNGVLRVLLLVVLPPSTLVSLPVLRRFHWTTEN